MALNFPSGQPNGTVWTDPNGEQWVYNAAENSWTSKGLVNETGGLKYKGGLNITAAPPTAEAGEFWSVETGGTAHAGFGPGVTGDIGTGSLILYDGTGWELINVDPSWVRTNGTITPVTPTDVIHGDSGVTVGPNDEIELNADGSASLAGGEVTIDSSGRLLAGTSSARTDLIAGTRGGRVQVEAASSTSADAIDNSSLCLTMGSSAPQGSANIFFTRTKSNSLGGVTSVGNNDILGGLYFQGTDGTDTVSAALIKAEVDSTPGANDMPGRLVFSTTADGESSPTERMRIDSSGAVTISTGDLTVNSLTVGRGAGNVSRNTANGQSALRNNTTGSSNTAVGYRALYSNTTGSINTANGQSTLRNNTTGSNNTAIGVQALYDNTTGSNNTAVGVQALYDNTTGSGNFGAAFRNSSGTYAPCFDPTTHDNRVVMGHTAVTNAYVQVAWTVVSDQRDKTNFGLVPHGLDFIKQLNPVSYQFKVDRDTDVANGPVRYGFKAQDILALEGEDNAVIIDNEDPDKLRYNGEALVPVLVNAIKEQQSIIETQQEQINNLLARLDAAGI